MRAIYLDHNATTRPADEVVQAMAEAMRCDWANPSSVHRFGQQVRAKVELARESVARLLNATPGEIVFTSSGTESCNLAIFGVAYRQVSRRAGEQGKKTPTPALPHRAGGGRLDSRLRGNDKGSPHPDPPPQSRGREQGHLARDVIITTPVEHSAVREPMERLEKEGFTVVRLPVSREGLIGPDDLAAAMAEHAGRVALVSIIWANNETGVIQPMEALLGAVREADGKTLFHTDAVQWVGKLPCDVRALPVDLLSFAGHKFHGPKGVGGLFVRKGVRLQAQILGGPHERERRGGTEDVPGIIGLGVAAELALRHLQSDHPAAGQTAARRDRLEQRLLNEVPGCAVNGATDPARRLWNTTNIAFDRLEAEAILLGLSERGVFASAGAACSSGSLDPSPILLAMGIEERLAHGSIRFSLAQETTDAEIESAVEVIVEVVRRLQRVLPVG
ncbi:MAG: aminotransferase class V-fold PLP-dependent enzyme [Phycisphaerales bacterium]|nr:aminotransferase class V-fold PLP-dependent enzyme [Phycisphaerales bacterium]